ncbi:hypothetical protein F4861DRAFT_57822 [Xylaria intraflava]|nr:hypothetical protein F4861DRAFT_57822 [Xylaria intraflava]
MKSLIVPLFAAVVTAASVAILPRQSSDACCFGLKSTGIVDDDLTEDHTGGLSLGGPFQQGGFCFDKSTKTIKDGLNHNCFMRAPAQQFQCYAGIIGATAFDISPSGPDGELHLTYDNGPGAFYACPVGHGADQYYNIFSASKPNPTGCILVTLTLYDSSASCIPTRNATKAILSSGVRPGISSRPPHLIHQKRSTGYTVTTSIVPSHSQVPRAGLLSGISRNASKPVLKNEPATASLPTNPSPICLISPSAPSIAPIMVGSPDDSAPGGVLDTSPNVSISYQNTSIFSYSIPSSFLTTVSAAGSSLCALQFRLPNCPDLPKDYPCFLFSGLEQQLLSNSGMNFDLILDDGQAVWNGSVLQQVLVNENRNKVLGTFECGMPNASYGGPSGARRMIWRATSVRQFGLDFLQAGVGENAEFQDGIGAWIVPCL